MAAICRELFGDEVSHQTVSQYAQRLEEELEPWRTRPLKGEHPYVFLDARYEKVRVEHRVGDMAVLVAIGVNTDGRKCWAWRWRTESRYLCMELPAECVPEIRRRVRLRWEPPPERAGPSCFRH